MYSTQRLQQSIDGTFDLSLYLAYFLSEVLRHTSSFADAVWPPILLKIHSVWEPGNGQADDSTRGALQIYPPIARHEETR